MMMMIYQPGRQTRRARRQGGGGRLFLLPLHMGENEEQLTPGLVERVHPSLRHARTSTAGTCNKVAVN